MLERVTGDAADTPARKPKLIARHGVGFDTVDIPVSRLGIIVTNTPAARGGLWPVWQ